ncbi:PO1 beta superfamily nucleotidyltransferase [Cryptosporidium felis]|nr:PO1 beta superfamily nucleotidyltransferase [Cryptosporidium felis]
MATPSKTLEAVQGRRSTVSSLEGGQDYAYEKKEPAGKAWRRPAHSNRKINYNPNKNLFGNGVNLTITESFSCQSSTRFQIDHDKSSINSSQIPQYRRKNLEKTDSREAHSISQNMNGTASILPLFASSSSPITVSTSKPGHISVASSDCNVMSKGNSNHYSKNKTCLNDNDDFNASKNGLCEPGQFNRNIFTQGAFQNIVSENQYSQLHLPLLTPIPSHYWCNQFVIQENVNNYVPPPPDYFPDLKVLPIAKKHELFLPADPSCVNSKIDISSSGHIEASSKMLNTPFPYFQPYSLRSYEISTLNIINYLIPNEDFQLRISNVVNDLKDWLRQANIPLFVFPYGSTSTGFADQFSDIDIALVPKQDLSDRNKYKNSPISDIFTKPPGLILQELLNLLQEDSSKAIDETSESPSPLDNSNISGDARERLINTSKRIYNETKTSRNPFACIQDITSAHIPIIRMLHTSTDIVLDVSIALPSAILSRKRNLDLEKQPKHINSLQKMLPIQKANSLSIIQSRLGILTWYARMDPRVVHVVVLTKVWTRFRGLRNTLSGFPGGYAWTICVIYFFQKIGILPVIDANEFFIKSQDASNLIFKEILEDINSLHDRKLTNPCNIDNICSFIGNNYVNNKRISSRCREKVHDESSDFGGSFPSLISDVDQEEITTYKEDMEDISNVNCDTETASGSAGIGEQVSVSDSSFDSEPDKISVEKDISSCKMLYLDVVKGGKCKQKLKTETRIRKNDKTTVNNKFSIAEDVDMEGPFMNIKNLSLEKSPEERELFGESGRSSVGSTACTYSLSPGIKGSVGVCLNCANLKCSCTSLQSNQVNPLPNVSAHSLDELGSECDFKKTGVIQNEIGNFLIEERDELYTKERLSKKKSTGGALMDCSMENAFDVDALFKNPPTLINNVKTLDESKFLKFSQSHTLFYRFLRFIETHLWTTVIDISSPEIISTTVPGICCDIRNPLPGPPACRPIFDENNKKHLRNEIQRAIQIIQSPFGDFSSICGSYLNLSGNNIKIPGTTSGTTGGTTPGMGLGTQATSFNRTMTKQKYPLYQNQFGTNIEMAPLHFIGCNPSLNTNQSNANVLLPCQIPLTSVHNDSLRHLVLPSISMPIRVPPPPPPKNKSSETVSNEKKF